MVVIKIIEIILILTIGRVSADSKDLSELCGDFLGHGHPVKRSSDLLLVLNGYFSCLVAGLARFLKVVDHLGQLLDFLVFLEKLHVQIRLVVRNVREPIALFLQSLFE